MNSQKIARNTIFMTIRMVVVMLITLFTTRQILAQLGIIDYGIYNVVAGFVSMFAFFNSSLSSAAQRFYNVEIGKDNESGVNGIYNISLRIHLLLGVLLVAVVEVLGVWYMNNNMVIPAERLEASKVIFHSSVLAMLFTVIVVPYTALVIAHEKFNFYATVGILDAVLKLLVVLSLTYTATDKLSLYGILILAISVFDVILYYVYIRLRFSHLHLIRTIDRKMVRVMLGFSGWRIFESLSYVFREQGVNLILNFFFGPVVNAAKGIANQINGAMQTVVCNISTPLGPQTVQMFSSGEKQKSVLLAAYNTKFAILILYILSAPAVIEMGFIQRLWLGTNVPEHSVAFASLLLLVNIFGAMVGPISLIIQATGRIGSYELFSGISNMMTIPLCIVAFYFFDIPELAFGALFITAIANTIVGLFAMRRLPDVSIPEFLRLSLSGPLKVILFTLPLFIIPVLLMDEGVCRFCVVLVYTLTIGFLLTYFVGLDSTERLTLKRIASNVMPR